MKALVPRVAWCGLAYGCIGLGAAGLVIPLLPTTPFLLVAAWAAPKGSQRLANWLWQHPRLGPTLQAWQRERAVSRRTKGVAVVMLLLSWVILWLGEAPSWVLGLTAVMFVSVATFLLTRPDVAVSNKTCAPDVEGRVSRF